MNRHVPNGMHGGVRGAKPQRLASTRLGKYPKSLAARMQIECNFAFVELCISGGNIVFIYIATPADAFPHQMLIIKAGLFLFSPGLTLLLYEVLINWREFR